MFKPTIHRNGTSREELLAQVLDADRAICAALKALAGAAPNGRDYYPQGASVIQFAVDEHRARVDKLIDVRKELNEIAEHIADAR